MNRGFETRLTAPRFFLGTVVRKMECIMRIVG
jgi:hypothetical protein